MPRVDLRSNLYFIKCAVSGTAVTACKQTKAPAHSLPRNTVCLVAVNQRRGWVRLAWRSEQSAITVAPKS